MKVLTLEARVEAGAALMDRRMPGWADHIDLSRLDLGDCQDCIIGQLLGEYYRGRRRIFWFGKTRRAQACGLEAFDRRDDVEFDRLTVLWKEAVIERQRVNAAAVRRLADRIIVSA